MKNNKYYYLEQRNGTKVVRRVPTTLEREAEDREKMEYLKLTNHKVFLVVSPTEEKIIN